MTLLSRHTCQIATTYGFSSKESYNLPHLVAAMAPQTGTSDEGYLALKTAVITSMRESGLFMSRTAGVLLDRQLLEREAPQMIRLIAYVSERLGIVVTQKELGILDSGSRGCSQQQHQCCLPTGRSSDGKGLFPENPSRGTLW